MTKIRHCYLTKEFFRKKIIEECKIQCVWVCSIEYLLTILRLSTRHNFHCWKPVDAPLAASEARQMLSWWSHYIDKVHKNFPTTCHRVFTYRLQCMPLQVIVISCDVLSTFSVNLKLLLVLFSQLVHLLFLCDATDIILRKYYRSRLLSACLNSAAKFDWLISTELNTMGSHQIL